VKKANLKMGGNLIIGRNGTFLKIKKNLITLNIRGNCNTVVNRFRITNLYINGNNNKIKVEGDGEINYIKIVGNNNKIYMKNISRRNYIDRGISNSLIKTRNQFVPLERNSPRHSLRIHNDEINNNNNNSILDNLEEKIYSEIPDDLKDSNLNKCSLCNETFLNSDKVKIFSCKKHIFHRGCLENFIKSNNNSTNCPRCESDINSNNNLNISNNPSVPHDDSSPIRNEPLNLEDNSRNNVENNSDNNHNNDGNEENNDSENNDSENNDNDNEDNNLDEDDNSDFTSLHEEGLDEEILDNLEIWKIKNVDKLDNDKKKCAICLEHYIKGDDLIALPCIHIFHANCIKNWLIRHSICPICKYKIGF